MRGASPAVLSSLSRCAPAPTTCPASSTTDLPRVSPVTGDTYLPSEHRAVGDAHPDTPAAWREPLERGRPVHGPDRRGPLSPRNRGGASGSVPADEGRLHVRPRLHLGPQAGHPDPLDRPGRDGPDVDPGAPVLAAQRTALRGAPGNEQGRDESESGGGTGPDLATQLCRPPAAARGDGPAPPPVRSPVRPPG